MCNLTRITKKKRVTVYKVAYKYVNKNKSVHYYALYTFVPIKKGKVLPQGQNDVDAAKKKLESITYYRENDHLYNRLAVGRSSGFKNISPAIELCNYFGDRPVVVLKVTLGGEIAQGDSVTIGPPIDVDEIVYAGSEIIDYEEVNH